ITSVMKKPVYKHPLFIIVALFFVGFFFVKQYAEKYISDAPIVLNKANPPKIIMYGSQTCMYCHIAKRFFEKHNLPYTEYDIDTSDKHREMFYILGGRGTPLLIVNDEIIHGYSERLIRDAL
ncbi:MAG: glutaredoxin family protein, partial [Thiomicrorhabdus sp.]|nr:glutaredoxin family protein [Thiomicrorhabdus sp.]